MKVLRNQQGYALLIVLFVVVMFMMLGAVFMAGSLNHANQERTVDTSNQAVAAAEMGVHHYKTDLHLDLTGIQQEVITATQQKIDELGVCIASLTDTSCDEEAEWNAKIEEIDLTARHAYLDKILLKINEIKSLGQEITGVDDATLANAEISYTLEEVIAPSSVTLTTGATTEVPITLKLKGTADNKEKTLTTVITAYVPETFLSFVNPTVIKLITEEESQQITEDTVFKSTPPAGVFCDAAFIETVVAGTAQKPYECIAKDGMTSSELALELKSKGLDPTLFKVYPEDFAEFAECKDKNGTVSSFSNCNGANLNGLNVFVSESNVDITSSMNNGINLRMVVDGTFTAAKNLNNTGMHDGNVYHQVIITRELNVDGNVQNMENTNLLILGKAEGDDARMIFGNQVEVSTNSKVCVNTDKVLESDIDDLLAKVNLTDGGQLVFYSSTTQVESGSEMTGVIDWVYDYGAFLETCGVTFVEKVENAMEVPNPTSLNELYIFDVTY